jgi:hypothetical protein
MSPLAIVPFWVVLCSRDRSNIESVPLVRSLLKLIFLIDVLFLVVSICCLYVCLCVVLATSRGELFVGTKIRRR